MITNEALAELSAKRDERETLSLLVDLGHSPDPSLFKGLSSRQERMLAARRFYEESTSRLAGEISREPDASFEPLEALGQAVVTATVATWRRLARPGRLLADDPKFRVLPNIEFHAI